MNWLALGWYLTLSILPQQNVFVGSNYLDHKEVVFSQEIGIDAELFDFVRIYTSINIFETTGVKTFAPFRSDYKIGVELYYERMTLGVYHQCNHPVISDFLNLYRYGENRTEVYFTYRGGNTRQ